MNKQVVYLISGKPHIPYLLVSLYTLRRYWQGRVIVNAWPESIDIVKRIAEDPNLGIDVYERRPKYRRKDGVKGNAQFLHKISLMKSLDCDAALYLDADTMVNGSIDLLFEKAEDFGFCGTQFNNWVSNGNRISKRIKRLIGIEGIDQDAVKRVYTNRYPSVNGGVFSCNPGSNVLDVWYDWTLLAKRVFIADETVLHVLSVCACDFTIALGGAYNCSPKHKSENLKDEDVHIWHGHGDCFVRPNKSPKAVGLWWPEYQKCLESNVGGITEWKDECGNHRLFELENRSEPTCVYCGKNLDNDDKQHHKDCPITIELEKLD